jgi:hypothetical protein
VAIMPGKVHQPNDSTREYVQRMSHIGLPQHHIARVLDISERTLRRHYKPEIDAGKLQGDEELAGWCWDDARNGDRTMRIFLAKVRLGYSTTERHELANADGSPLVTDLRVTFVSPTKEPSDEAND